MKRMKLKTKNSLIGLIFVSPWILGFLIFTAFPLIYSFFLSFQEVKITTDGIDTNFVKLTNYQYMFSVDTVFVEDLLSYIWHLLASVPIIIVFSLIIALLLNKKVIFRGFFRTIFFLPVIITSGPVIQELIDQGATTIPALQEFEEGILIQSGEGFFISLFLFLTKNIIVLLWFSGVQILIFLAALQKLDKNVYEAAMVDGASGWESFWKITLPSVIPMIIVNIIYTIVNLSVFSLNPVINHIQINMFKIETGFGYAAALSWIYFIVITLILLIVVGVMFLLGRKSSASS